MMRYLELNRPERKNLPEIVSKVWDSFEEFSLLSVNIDHR
jgi:hypothetical protein